MCVWTVALYNKRKNTLELNAEKIQHWVVYVWTKCSHWPARAIGAGKSVWPSVPGCDSVKRTRHEVLLRGAGKLRAVLAGHSKAQWLRGALPMP